MPKVNRRYRNTFEVFKGDNCATQSLSKRVAKQSLFLKQHLIKNVHLNSFFNIGALIEHLKIERKILPSISVMSRKFVLTFKPIYFTVCYCMMSCLDE